MAKHKAIPNYHSGLPKKPKKLETKKPQ